MQIFDRHKFLTKNCKNTPKQHAKTYGLHLELRQHALLFLKFIEITATEEVRRWESLKQTGKRHASALQWRRSFLHVYFYVGILTF